METISSRIEMAMGNRAVKDVAALIGVPQTTLRSYLKDTEPRTSVLVALAKELEVDLVWLATGEGTQSPSLKNRRRSFNVRYLDDSLMSANQRVWHTEKSRFVSDTWVSEGWLHNELDLTNFDGLRWCYVDSDAMGLALRKGNLTLIDVCKDGSSCAEGVYAAYVQQSLVFRRVQPGDDGKVLFVPDNPTYKPISVPRELIVFGERAGDGMVTIIGRVVYVCHRL